MNILVSSFVGSLPIVCSIRHCFMMVCSRRHWCLSVLVADRYAHSSISLFYHGFVTSRYIVTSKSGLVFLSANEEAEYLTYLFEDSLVECKNHTWLLLVLYKFLSSGIHRPLNRRISSWNFLGDWKCHLSRISKIAKLDSTLKVCCYCKNIKRT